MGVSPHPLIAQSDVERPSFQADLTLSLDCSPDITAHDRPSALASGDGEDRSDRTRSVVISPGLKPPSNPPLEKTTGNPAQSELSSG